jgi:hypothetical protein
MSDPNSTSPDILSDGPGKDILRPALKRHIIFAVVVVGGFAARPPPVFILDLDYPRIRFCFVNLDHGLPLFPISLGVRFPYSL